MTMKCEGWLRSVDRFCAHLNAGLSAVAIALAVVVAIQLTMRAETALYAGQQQPLVAQNDYVRVVLMTLTSP